MWCEFTVRMALTDNNHGTPRVMPFSGLPIQTQHQIGKIFQDQGLLGRCCIGGSVSVKMPKGSFMITTNNVMWADLGLAENKNLPDEYWIYWNFRLTNVQREYEIPTACWRHDPYEMTYEDIKPYLDTVQWMRTTKEMQKWMKSHNQGVHDIVKQIGDLNLYVKINHK